MIEAADFIAPAKARGFDFYTGVPCSFLTPLIDGVISDKSLSYIGAASEGEAVAIAAGAWLAGRKTVVMCQNSGLGNAVNPLTSLNYPFRIPTLFITTWRGQPGLKDEPQHELMGRVMDRLLATIEIPHRAFPADRAEVAPALDEAEAAMAESGLPFAFIMAKGSVAKSGLDQTPVAPRGAAGYRDLRAGGTPPTRAETLTRFLEIVPEAAAVVATTGKCGRELFTLADRKQHFYQVGSMGCATSMALGVALNAARPVIVLDGDGAALMKLGTMATVGAYGPKNFVHLLLDNGVHDSTGGQMTVSPAVDFAKVALACNYADASSCDSLTGFAEAVTEALGRPGPSLIHMHIQPGSMPDLGRPTISPRDVARRFKAFLAEN
jgi:phosphonopyruvate decarboxylase